MDFRDLNKPCSKDSYPLAIIDQLVDATSGHKLLSFMDSYSGNNQIKMAEGDANRITFHLDGDIYHYTVMPFGHINAGTTYKRMLNKLFAGMIGVTMEAYLDNVMAKSIKGISHVEDMRNTFECMCLH